jgi:hypothetical protein
MYDDARRTWSKMLEDAYRVATEAIDQANERHEEIERQTVYLRALRDSTKMQVETFLSGLLDHVGQLWADRAARPGAGGAPGRRPPNRTFS